MSMSESSKDLIRSFVWFSAMTRVCLLLTTCLHYQAENPGEY